MLVDAQVSSRKTRRSGSSRGGARTSPRGASQCPGGPARWHGPSFFARDAVAAEVAPERGYAGQSALLGQTILQLGQDHVRHLGEGDRDQPGMGFSAVGEPVTTLRLGSSVAPRASQSLPADRT